ncbi:MAG: hypothetical protein Q7S54_00045 [bacterium]|nr:hypothetical protein [bacterium]
MTDNNGNNGNGNGSATTVLVTVIIIVIIGLAFYFGFVRGNWGTNRPEADSSGVNIDVTVPAGEPGGGIAE